MKATAEEVDYRDNIFTRIKNRYKNSAVRYVFSEPMGIASLILVALIILIAVFAPFLAPRNPNEIDIINSLEGPSRSNLMGTDNLGRDIMSRVIYGTRIALFVAFSSMSIAVIIALILGVIAGYASEGVDNFLLIMFDIIRSFPALILAIVFRVMVGQGLLGLIIIIGFTSFPGYARLIRAQVLKIKKSEYVVAAQALGVPAHKIMLRHLLPNAIGPLFIQIAMDVPVVITFEAGLSFLGLGVPPPTPSWGSILYTGYSYVRVSPWMIIFAGSALALATLGFTILGETLRDNLDPKLRQN